MRINYKSYPHTHNYNKCSYTHSKNLAGATEFCTDVELSSRDLDYIVGSCLEEEMQRPWSNPRNMIVLPALTN